MTDPALPCVDVVIVNWNSGAQLAACLGSFAAVSGDAVRLGAVIVIDNASADRSADGLETLVPTLPLRVIRNAGNRGFGAACNQGARGSTADHLLFLNPDVRLMPGSLESAARHLALPANANVGIAGVRLVDDEGRTAPSCARFPTARSMIGVSLGLDRLGTALFPPHFMTEWSHDQTRVVDQVMGAFFFVRRSLFEAQGGFDERFFVYFEDLDFALEARRRGYASLYIADAKAFHRGQGTTAQIEDVRLYYFTRSRILYAWKHFRGAPAVLVTCVILLLEPLARIAHAMMSGNMRSVRAILRGYRLLWANAPGIFRATSEPSNAERPAPHAL